MRDLATLTVEDFAPTVGDLYRVTAGPEGRYAEALEVRLAAAEGRGTAPAPLRDPFALLFEGPPATVLAQGTYLLAHATLGELTIFLVPVGRTDEATRYEAIFA
ncbi:hypothetical protein [Patulibacter sp. SYSU D01012]|uniref:DUF6916 family protein n=1 Tax=Patulibacter sp. SYSU D01012 TaxID=2817381 RepID=UPI001B30C7AA|nr:hypothetical protein [Patulibacter sp. SYSU D01012]